MTALDILLAAEAFVVGDAQRRATVCHRHLDDSPMVIVGYRLAGEAGAPLGIMYGTAPEDPRLVVAPEPRNRDMRFRDVLDPLARDIVAWLENFAERDADGQCLECPQILVPNRGTHEFVRGLLGRSLRYLRSTPEFAVADETVLLGAHATWFAQQSELPGSSVLLAATDLLRRHWATGQSSLEDEDLHALLAWVDPAEGLNGREAAAKAEAGRASGEIPAAGPTPDASWDRDVLGPLVDEFNEHRGGDASPKVVSTAGASIRGAVEAALTASWTATWRAHALLCGLVPGASVADRWGSDRRAWTSHLTRVEAGRAFFRTRDSARQSAWMIKSREDAQQALDLGEALDDPLVLAGLVAGGEAFDGEIREIDSDNMEMGPSGRRRVRRPLITVDLPDPCPLVPGTKVRWTDRMQLACELVGIEDNAVVLKVIAGMQGQLPIPGATAAFITLDDQSYPMPSTLPGIPWTHEGADVPEPDSEVPERPHGSVTRLRPKP
ncbi:MAG: hypothetical protein KC461_14285 [Dehalococcoidia bacterium]|nr:hypothetical protein [Dehalococcoidia bacterium]